MADIYTEADRVIIALGDGNVLTDYLFRSVNSRRFRTWLEESADRDLEIVRRGPAARPRSRAPSRRSGPTSTSSRGPGGAGCGWCRGRASPHGPPGALRQVERAVEGPDVGPGRPPQVLAAGKPDPPGRLDPARHAGHRLPPVGPGDGARQLSALLFHPRRPAGWRPTSAGATRPSSRSRPSSWAAPRPRTRADYVYGYRGLVSPAVRDYLEVDYTKPPMQVFYEVMVLLWLSRDTVRMNFIERFLLHEAARRVPHVGARPVEAARAARAPATTAASSRPTEAPCGGGARCPSWRTTARRS